MEQVVIAESFDPTTLPSIQDIFGVSSTNRKVVYAAFYKHYSPFVVHELTKRNTFTLNFEDLNARLWMEFSGSSSGVGLIERFFAQVASVAPDLPEELSAEEVAYTLSISWETWRKTWHGRNILKQGLFMKLPKLPAPVKGSYQDRNAVYASDQISDWFIEFEQVRHLFVPEGSVEWNFQLPMPKATKRYFINYLKTSIVNRWANFCRHEARRHQERVWDTFPDQRSTMEDPPPWEDRQESPSNQEEDAELALLVKRLQKSAASSQVQPILLGMFDDGLSVRESIERSSLTPEQKRQAIREVCDRRTRTAA